MLAGKATKTVVFCAILLLTVASVRAQQSKTLSIEGRIVGWDLASSLLPSYEPFDSPIHRFVVVVRIERVLKGKSKSSFLVVHVKSDKRQKARNSELEDSIVE